MWTLRVGLSHGDRYRRYGQFHSTRARRSRLDTSRLARSGAGTRYARDRIRRQARTTAHGPDELRAKGHDVPIDKENANVLVLTSTIDVQVFKDSLEATVKVMNHLGLNWTLYSCAFEGANFGLLSGCEAVQKQASERITNQAIALGAGLVIVPECGHAYPALRWGGCERTWFSAALRGHGPV